MDDRRLSFAEHLDELRGCVVRAVLWLCLSCGACLFFQDQLMRVVLFPQQKVASVGREERSADAALELEAVLAEVRARPAGATPTAAEKRALGARFAAVFTRLAAEPDAPLAFLSPQEAFLAYIQVSFICGLFVASPLVARELWRFIAAGLHDHEQRWVRIFAPLTFACFAGGALFGYFVLIPVSLEYLETYGATDLVVPSITLDSYLGLFFAMTFALGLIFEVPLVAVFLSLLGVVDAAILAEYRRYWMLAATIIAALITPTGDPLTLSIVVLPLIVLYEIGIALARLSSSWGAAPPTPSG